MFFKYQFFEPQDTLWAYESQDMTHCIACAQLVEEVKVEKKKQETVEGKTGGTNSRFNIEIKTQKLFPKAVSPVFFVAQ